MVITTCVDVLLLAKPVTDCLVLIAPALQVRYDKAVRRPVYPLHGAWHSYPVPRVLLQDVSVYTLRIG